MKLRVILGLLLAGSLFVGTAVQAQYDDLTGEELDLLQEAQEALEKATTAEERQKAEENLQQVQDALRAVRQPVVIPGVGTITVVTVDCKGNCAGPPNNILTLRRICAQVGGGFMTFSLDCQDVTARVPTGSAGIQCADKIRQCYRAFLDPDHSIGDYCLDTPGWDAHVFCYHP